MQDHSDQGTDVICAFPEDPQVVLCAAIGARSSLIRRLAGCQHDATGSRKHIIRILARVDADLRHRRVREVAGPLHTVLYAYWRKLIKAFPTRARSVRSLERYLGIPSVIASHGSETAPRSRSAVISNKYANPPASGSPVCRLDHRPSPAHGPVSSESPEGEEGFTCLDPAERRNDVHTYVNQAAKRLSRASLLHEIAALHRFLRFLARVVSST